MDEKDRRIIEILEDDGRASYTDIAEELDVSEGTVRNRVDSMVEEGVIEKFTVETSREGSRAIVMIKLSTGVSIDKIVQEMPGRMEVNEVTGDFDLVVKFSRSTNKDLNDALDSIREVEGVEETKTYTVLRQRSL